jgi:preprotein translocase subunit SecY
MEAGHRKFPFSMPSSGGTPHVWGQTTHLPLKLNTSGVIPPIFASSIISFPNDCHLTHHPWLEWVSNALAPATPLYTLANVVMIFFFCYFYTAIIFNPMDVAENMKKYGGFIPGMRPGKRTAEYIDRTLTRLTFVGAIYLSFVVILPDYMIRYLNVPFYFGGTGLLIVVGVAMDTMQQIESHLVMRHYESFLKKGRLRGRR